MAHKRQSAIRSIEFGSFLWHCFSLHNQSRGGRVFLKPLIATVVLLGNFASGQFEFTYDLENDQGTIFLNEDGGWRTLHAGGVAARSMSGLPNTPSGQPHPYTRRPDEVGVWPVVVDARRLPSAKIELLLPQIGPADLLLDGFPSNRATTTISAWADESSQVTDADRTKLASHHIATITREKTTGRGGEVGPNTLHDITDEFFEVANGPSNVKFRFEAAATPSLDDIGSPVLRVTDDFGEIMQSIDSYQGKIMGRDLQIRFTATNSVGTEIDQKSFGDALAINNGLPLEQEVRFNWLSQIVGVPDSWKFFGHLEIPGWDFGANIFDSRDDRAIDGEGKRYQICYSDDDTFRRVDHGVECGGDLSEWPQIPAQLTDRPSREHPLVDLPPSKNGEGMRTFFYIYETSEGIRSGNFIPNNHGPNLGKAGVIDQHDWYYGVEPTEILNDSRKFGGAPIVSSEKNPCAPFRSCDSGKVVFSDGPFQSKDAFQDGGFLRFETQLVAHTTDADGTVRELARGATISWSSNSTHDEPGLGLVSVVAHRFPSVTI